MNPSDVKLVAFDQPKHPVLRVFPREFWEKLVAELGLAKAADKWNGMVRERNEAIRRMESDPLNHGFEPAHWLLVDLLWGWIGVEEFCDRVKSRWGVPEPEVIEQWRAMARAGAFAQLAKDILLLGGWRSSKTTYMLKRAVQCLIKYPGALIWVFHDNAEASKKVHQLPVWKLLPEDWRRAGKKEVGYVSFKQKTGFTDMSFIGPNESQMMFKTYGQAMEGMQGFQLGDPQGRPCLGAVCDELVPLWLVDTLAGRCMTYKATLFRGFTPIKGHNSVVEKSVEGAEQKLAVPSLDLADAKYLEMPLVLEKLRRVEGDDIPPMLNRTVYFPTRWNLFQDIKEVRQRVAGKPIQTRTALLYGKTYKLDTGQFAKLDEAVHAFDEEKDLPPGTDYLVEDPAGARQFFMLWARVDVFGRMWIWREWPCEAYYIEDVGWPGPWAEEGLDPDSKHQGFVAGSGQLPDWGWGLERYKREIATIEEWEDRKSDKPVEEWSPENGAKRAAYMRIMDGRTAGTGGYGKGPKTTILDAQADLGLHFVAAEGKDIEEGLRLINDKLDFREGWERPQDGPQLFIGKKCRNLWFCLKNLPPNADRKNPLKDPVDVLRYLVTADPFYVDQPAQVAGVPKGREGKIARLFKAMTNDKS